MTRLAFHFSIASVYLILSVVFVLLENALPTEVPLAFACEFGGEECCVPGLAAAQLACEDADAKDGAIVPELGSTSKTISLRVTDIVDPITLLSRIEFISSVETKSNPPVAVIGSYWSSRIRALSQNCFSLGLSQIAWGTSTFWYDNPDFSGVFRVPPNDVIVVKAIHEVLKLKEVKEVAVVCDEEDVWAQGIIRNLRSRCEGNPVLPCSVIVFGISSSPLTPADITTLLDKIVSIGIRTIIGALLVKADILDLLRAASGRGLVGSRVEATGYMWIFPVVYWSADDTSNDYIWRGSISLEGKPIKTDKLAAFRNHWRERIPRMHIRSSSGHELTMADAYNVDRCLDIAALAYDSVARVRLALERVDLSLPTAPGTGLRSHKWIGSQLMEELQYGDSMDGITQGPSLRRTSALSMLWNENDAAISLVNYAGEDKTLLEIFKSDSQEGLVSTPGLAEAVLPGDAPFDTNDAGKMVSTPCGFAAIAKCRSRTSFGTCQPKPQTGAKPGWCRCDETFVGRFCSIRGRLSEPPASVVRVNFSMRVLAFEGLNDAGDRFFVGTSVNLSWRDRRVPWDDGEYVDQAAFTLLQDTWFPTLKLSGTARDDYATVLYVQRDSIEESKGSEADVVLSLVHKIRSTQRLKTSFAMFPFDSHDLFATFASGKANMEIQVLPSTLVPDSALDDWDPQWALDGEPELVFASSEGSMKLQFSVARRYHVVIFRLITPSSVLIAISWSAFYISPRALMPRFASGFISFLSLQGFKSYAIALMPNDGKIPEMSWIDIYITVAGYLMGLAVAETVLVQYITEKVAAISGMHIDATARWYFPFTWVLLLAVLSIGPAFAEISILNYVAQGAFLVLALAFFCYVVFEAVYFPHLTIRRCLRTQASGARRFKKWKFDESELHIIYDYIDAFYGKASTPDSVVRTTSVTSSQSFTNQGSGVRQGAILTTSFLAFIVASKPAVRCYSDEILKLLQTILGGDSFKFPTFQAQFANLLTEITLLLVHHAEDEKLSIGMQLFGMNPDVSPKSLLPVVPEADKIWIATDPAESDRDSLVPDKLPIRSLVFGQVSNGPKAKKTVTFTPDKYALHTWELVQ